MLLRDRSRAAERRRVLLSGIDLGMELALWPDIPVSLRCILPVYHRQTLHRLSRTPACINPLRRPPCCSDPWDNEAKLFRKQRKTLGNRREVALRGVDGHGDVCLVREKRRSRLRLCTRLCSRLRSRWPADMLVT
jgi:hypothetical protein